MYCAHCGKELQDDYTACPYCGTPVKKEPTAEEKQEPAQKQHETGHTAIIVVSIICGAALIITIILAATLGSLVGKIVSWPAEYEQEEPIPETQEDKDNNKEEQEEEKKKEDSEEEKELPQNRPEQNGIQPRGRDDQNVEENNGIDDLMPEINAENINKLIEEFQNGLNELLEENGEAEAV